MSFNEELKFIFKEKIKITETNNKKIAKLLARGEVIADFH